MRRILLKNIRIFNPGGKPSYINNGHIVIADSVIESAGSGSIKEEGFDEIVDLNGKTALPGMINAHTHLYSSLALGMPLPKNTPVNFVGILREIWWKLDLALDIESTKASFEAGLLECLKSGVTTVIDHHSSQNFIEGSLDTLVETAEKMGVNISTSFEVTDRNGAERFEAGLAENIAAWKKYSGNHQVHSAMGLHASFTLEDESLRIIREALHDAGDWGIHIHVAEDKADQKDAEAKGYPSVIRRLHHFDLLNDRSIIVHGLHMKDDDIEILKDRGCVLVHCPASNANNRVGILPVNTIQSLQAGLGTDGMHFNMPEEAKTGMLIRSSTLPGGAENVDYGGLLFKNNPAIVSRLFGRKIGLIAPGHQADIAVYDYESRTDINENNVIGHILFGLGKPSEVMTRGEFRIRNGVCLEVNEDEIMENSRRQSVRLWDRMELL